MNGRAEDQPELHTAVKTLASIEAVLHKAFKPRFRRLRFSALVVRNGYLVSPTRLSKSHRAETSHARLNIRFRYVQMRFPRLTCIRICRTSP